MTRDIKIQKKKIAKAAMKNESKRELTLQAAEEYIRKKRKEMKAKYTMSYQIQSLQDIIEIFSGESIRVLVSKKLDLKREMKLL